MTLSATIAAESSGRKLEMRSSVTSVSWPGSVPTTNKSNQKPTMYHFVRRPPAHLPSVCSITSPCLFHALAQRFVEGVVTAVQLRLEVRGEHDRGQPAGALLRHDESDAPVAGLDLERAIDVEDAGAAERREPAQLAVRPHDGHARAERHLQPVVELQADLELLARFEPSLGLPHERVP